jgi:zinc D-Ala-D-Ala carboxypeptidase
MNAAERRWEELMLKREKKAVPAVIETPIRILSGYRCPEHNRAVGGVASSQHLQGKSADITTAFPLQALHCASEVPFKGCRHNAQ